jgi:hypothetical protein
MAIEERTVIERIEIVLDPAGEARGASVSLMTGLWDDEQAAWTYPPRQRQVGLGVAKEQGYEETLANVLGTALTEALSELDRAKGDLAARDAEIERLTAEHAALDARLGAASAGETSG